MKNSVLTSSRSSPMINSTVDSDLESIQQRTRTNMLKAAELAHHALGLEKDQQWTEALEAYGEVCSFFKKIMENADSSDLHDLLYLYHQYSKRLTFIKSKVFGSGISNSLQLSSQSSPPTSPQFRSNSSSNQELAFSSSTPRFLRNRSDSYTNPSNLSPLTGTRRPSLAPNLPLPPTPTSNSSRHHEIHTKLSREILINKNPGSNPFISPRSSSRNVDQKKDGSNLMGSDSDGQTRRTYDISLASLNERIEPKRVVDLNSIPENDEFAYESTRPRGLSQKSEARPISQYRPRLTHNPSMPNLSISRPSKLDANLLGSGEGKFYKTIDSSFFNNGRRDSCAILSDWDFSRPSGFPSPSESSTYISDITQTRNSSLKSTWADRNLTDNSTLHSPGASISSLIDSSPDSSPRLSSNSLSNSASEELSFSLLPGSSSIARAHNSPDGPQLSIHTQLPVRSAFDLMSPNACSSPLPSSENYGFFTPKYNLSVFQVLWNEEVHSKPIWSSPPKSTVLRPLWQIECLRLTLTTGGYIGSKRIFVHPSIWKQSGLRLPGLDVKIHVLTYLSEYLSRLGEHWLEDVLGIRQGLDDLEALTTNMHQTLTSKLAVVPPIKKSQNSATIALFSLASKISKSVERFQATVSREKLEDASSYLDLLVSFFESCKFLEDWYLHYTSRNSLHTIHTAIVQRLQRFFEFLNSVIVAFVLHDLNICLAKYFKRIRELALE